MSVNVTVNGNRVVVKQGGPPGPEGPPGAAGSGDTQQYTAGATISALRMLTIDASGNAVYANQDDTPVGLSLTATSSGDTVTVATSDHVVEDDSWNWTLGQPVLLGTNGTLTQDPTGMTRLTVVGRPASATRLIVKIQPAITLA